MIYLHMLNALLMLVIPIGLAFYITARWKMGGKHWLIGATIFILSQVGHIPFNILAGKLLNQTSLVSLPQQYQVLFNAIFLGLSAGIWEETARLAMYGWWVKKARSWKEGILLGLGHGGSESILVGVLALYSLLQVLAVRTVDISKLVTPEQLPDTLARIAEYWSMPWYMALMGSFERILTIPIQVAFSVLVLQVFLKNKIRWYWIAIVLHALIDASAVLLINYSNIFLTEGLIACFSLISIGFIIRMRTPDKIKQADVRIPSSERMLGNKSDKNDTHENLEETIYQ
jgi:uncharacterized membrane protein YhfC